MKLFGDGTLCVAFGGQLWTFSPSCLVAYRPEEEANLDVAERARENKSAGTQLRQPVGGGAAPSQHVISAPPHHPPGSLSVALDRLRAQKSDAEHPGRLVVEVALGNVARALDLVRRHPQQASPRAHAPARAASPREGVAAQGLTCRLSLQVDTKNQGRTALQVAAYLGQVELVRLLLQARADVDLPDDEANRALHYAALG